MCDHNLDSIKGFVDSKELLIRVISGQSIDLNSGSLVQNVIIIPDTSTSTKRWSTSRTIVATLPW